MGGKAKLLVLFFVSAIIIIIIIIIIHYFIFVDSGDPFLLWRKRINNRS
jgi:thiosulfate reductase cytochrome b subunit